MDKFALAQAFTSLAEGGLVDNPADPGGITNHGVSLRYLRSIGHDIDGDGDVDGDDIRHLTPEQAAELFKAEFWDGQRLDMLPARVGVAQYDAAVNMGPRQAGQILQDSCNHVALLYPSAFSCPLAVDGRVGQYTIGRVRSICLNADMAGRLVMFMLGHRIAFYDDLIRKNPKLQVFQKGWTARVANLGKYLEKIPAEVA